ncbi:hypothetical protein HETIRDRAFT_101348 [Heterobasidion irregulare TC 32-1]|uniref:BTB domain-containing protein n=1 Tax=Heterobasidion irregulare (strain TC 32-1) TaxID=747525 RepID=W4K8J7_HETIT|nr:uncharacterized protein HETIRDRAFT_101348 [Heterobasidion irregulare TC 32-1]ETW82157.1 hypothetical protein HETIRDRAFT_101348 [Heterobasidion irregulare TC 32-1]
MVDDPQSLLSSPHRRIMISGPSLPADSKDSIPPLPTNSEESQAHSIPANSSLRPSLKRDRVFYLETVVFQVENILFRVPKCMLPDDEGAFADMFLVPQGGKEKEGLSDDNPIVLPSQVTIFGFRCFLKVTYPQLPGGSEVLSTDEWMAVLELADMWQVPKMRMKAINAMEKNVQNSGAVEMILLARKYRISSWLIKGYGMLARRPDPITSDERERLSLDTFMRLVGVREKGWKYAVYGTGDRNSSRSYSASSQHAEFNFDSEVRAVFKDELMKDEEYRIAHRN